MHNHIYNSIYVQIYFKFLNLNIRDFFGGYLNLVNHLIYVLRAYSMVSF